ncbi:MAG: hypothetical protein WCI73_05795 [Phycisphaerae bacterium]
MIRRFLPMVFLLLLVTVALIAWPQDQGPASEPATQTISFRSLDIYVAPHGAQQALAAYQVELRVTRGDAVIIGVEGGEHPAFTKPPYYDPAALQNQRILLAAFSTDQNLPHGKTRVARLHFQVRGNQAPEYSIKLDIAADPVGKPLAAAASVTQGDPR